MEDKDSIMTIKKIKEVEDKSKTEIESAKEAADKRVKVVEEGAAKNIEKEKTNLNADFEEKMKKIITMKKKILNKAAVDGESAASKLIVPKKETIMKAFVDALKAKFKV